MSVPTAEIVLPVSTGFAGADTLSYEFFAAQTGVREGTGSLERDG